MVSCWSWRTRGWFLRLYLQYISPLTWMMCRWSTGLLMVSMTGIWKFSRNFLKLLRPKNWKDGVWSMLVRFVANCFYFNKQSLEDANPKTRLNPVPNYFRRNCHKVKIYIVWTLHKVSMWMWIVLYRLYYVFCFQKCHFKKYTKATWIEYESSRTDESL